MGQLDVGDRLKYAHAVVAELRTLEGLDATMRYRDLAKAIGLISPSGKWEAWHRQQIAEILQIVAAAERYRSGNKNSSALNFKRIVTASGRAGKGVTRTSRIIRE